MEAELPSTLVRTRLVAGDLRGVLKTDIGVALPDAVDAAGVLAADVGSGTGGGVQLRAGVA